MHYTITVYNTSHVFQSFTAAAAELEYRILFFTKIYSYAHINTLIIYRVEYITIYACT